MQEPQQGLIDTTIHYAITGKELMDLMEHHDSTEYQQKGGKEGILDVLEVHAETGIPSNSIPKRRQQYGNNILPLAERDTFFEIWKEALSDQTLIILIISAVVSLVLAFIVPNAERKCASTIEFDSPDYLEGLAILVAVFAVSLIGAWNDYSKQSKFIEIEAKEVDRAVKVIRDGNNLETTTSQLVVGDIVYLSVGDVVPADGIFLKGNNLRIDESEMTGESVAVKKSDEHFVCLSGCKVTDGNGQMVVVAVGQNSQWGQLKEYVNKDKERPTPLQERLDDLAELIGKVGMICAVVVFAVLTLWWFYKALTFSGYVMKDNECKLCDPTKDADKCAEVAFDWWRITDLVDYFIIAVTIVVVAVPEGLPLAVTVSLAYSMKQMFKDNNLVRHLKACETMSNATCICCDKTGTLTENRMNVTSMWIGDKTVEIDSQPNLHISQELMTYLTTNIAINTSLSSNINENNDTIGNKTDCALLLLLKKLGHHCNYIRTNHEISRQWVFSSENKRMDTLSKNVLYSKGAPEIIMEEVTTYLNNEGQIVELTQQHREEIERIKNEWQQKGRRVLALSCKIMNDEETAKWTESQVGSVVKANGSSLLCIVGISDPLRYEVPGAIQQCKDAGITVRMVTGDNIETALSIARECGMVNHDCRIVTKEDLMKKQYDHSEIAMIGKDFGSLSDEEIDGILDRIKILARCSPLDKQRLVERLINADEIVAVTGDGTNDVPAFKEADVALAMGLRGTDVAKQAADIVILDDNFNSIVKAVMWGRCVYDNIRKFIQFQVTVNIVALALCVIGSVCQMGSPLNTMQMLWVNLIMDTLAALALGTEKPNVELLKRKPFKRGDSLLSRQMIIKIGIQVIYQLFILLIILFFGSRFSFLDAPCGYMSTIEDYPGKQYICADGQAHTLEDVIEHTKILQTIIFNTFVFCQIFNEINSRRVNGETNVFEGIFTNYMFIGIEALQVIVQVVIVVFSGATFGVKSYPGISFGQWFICIFLSALSIPLGYLNGYFNKQQITNKYPSINFNHAHHETLDNEEFEVVEGVLDEILTTH